MSSSDDNVKASGRRGLRWIFIGIAAVVLVVLGAWWRFGVSHPKFFVTTCFPNVEGLRPGATVRIAGVDVGYVKTVRAQPDDASCMAFVEMAVTAEYPLRIPQDSVVTIQTAGILGGPYPEIDVSQASGPAVQDGGRLASRPPKQSVLKDAVEAIQTLPSTVESIRSLQDTEKALDKSGAKTLPKSGGRPKPKAAK
jgi:phospholipid/cholesterol/gamma-HCH transport system substrate-binding protein